MNHPDNGRGGGGTGHQLIVGALRKLLIGACVELRFASSALHHGARGCRTLAEVKQKRRMSKLVATGVKLLGASRDETVLSLLSAQLPTSPQPSMTTQQNSNDHDSSSFLYDTKSQAGGTVIQKTGSLLQLESFNVTQSGGSLNVPPPALAQDDVHTSEDWSYMHTTVDDEEITEGIVREMETEWESTQLSQQYQRQQLPEADLALSEDLLSELQQSFDQPSPAPTPLLPNTAATPLSQFTDGDSYLCRSSTSRMCYGTPELFSSHKKPTQRGKVGELEPPSFSPELFGPTPLVSRYTNDDASLSITPLAVRMSKVQPPKRTLLHDRTRTPLSHDITPQVLDSGSRQGKHTHPLTPLTHNKESFKLDDIASPDLFS